MRHVFYLSAVLWTMVVAPATRAVDPATLIDRELNRESIQFMSVANQRVRYFGADRRMVLRPIEEVVRLEFARAASEASPVRAGQLRLNDGHILPGELEGVDDEGNLKWRTDTWGVMDVSLDDVLWFDVRPVASADPAAPDLGTPDSDLVILANGDRIEGFVEDLTPQGLVLSREDQTLELPWDSVARVHLANPSQARPGVWLALRDGARVRIEHLHIAAGQVSGLVFGRKVELPAESLAGIDFAQRHRLIAMRDLPHRTLAGGEAFGVPYPPHWTAHGLRLHAPITVTFNLPAGARRLSAQAELADTDLSWADLIVVLRDGQGELLRQPLNKSQPAAALRAELRDRTLTFEINEGAHGPIFDRMRLSDPVVLVEIDPENP